MRKQIPPPANWQDFESLCKKLWGEIWEIPQSISKNETLGQDQSGVDISGIPKFATNYYGLLCKGKNGNLNSRLTEKEVRTEIQNALDFKPKLETYIIATTAPKDAKIQEIVRQINLDNRNRSLFEVQLCFWEDIEDFLFDHRKVFDWYLLGIGHRDKYDFRILFNELEERIVLKPILKRRIKKHISTNKSLNQIIADNFIKSKTFTGIPMLFFPQEINKSWVNFDFIMENCGSVTIDDWRIIVKFKEGVRKLYDGQSLLSYNLNYKPYVENDTKTIFYKPQNNSPIVQKDNDYFKISLLPEPSAEKIVAEWEIIARDFTKTGIFEIFLEPEYIDEIEVVELHSGELPQEDEVSIHFHVE